MGGILDASRFRAFLAWQLNVSPEDIETTLLGGHGDQMVWIVKPRPGGILHLYATINDGEGLREIDLLDGELIFTGHHELVDHFRGMRAHDVCAQNLPVLRVADDLHEAVGLARGARAPVRREGELADLVLELLLLALLLGEPPGRRRRALRPRS